MRVSHGGKNEGQIGPPGQLESQTKLLLRVNQVAF